MTDEEKFIRKVWLVTGYLMGHRSTRTRAWSSGRLLVNLRRGEYETVLRRIKKVTPGFTECVEIGRPEWTFEALVLEFPNLFPAEDVALCKQRLRATPPKKVSPKTA